MLLFLYLPLSSIVLFLPLLRLSLFLLHLVSNFEGCSEFKLCSKYRSDFCSSRLWLLGRSRFVRLPSPSNSARSLFVYSVLSCHYSLFCSFLSAIVYLCFTSKSSFCISALFGLVLLVSAGRFTLASDPPRLGRHLRLFCLCHCFPCVCFFADVLVFPMPSV